MGDLLDLLDETPGRRAGPAPVESFARTSDPDTSQIDPSMNDSFGRLTRKVMETLLESSCTTRIARAPQRSRSGCA